MPYTLQEEVKRNNSDKGLFFKKQALLLIRDSKNNQPSPLASHLLPFQNNYFIDN